MATTTNSVDASIGGGRAVSNALPSGKPNGPVGMTTFPPSGIESVHNGRSTVAMATSSVSVNQPHGYNHVGKVSRDGTVATVIERLDSTHQDKEEEEIIVDEAEEPSRGGRGLKPSGEGDKRIRTKKQKDVHGSEQVGGSGDGGKNDSYCWVCHEGGEVLCCDKCPRVFHFRCSKLPQEPEGEEWYCSVCTGLARSRRIKKTKPDDLQECLRLAVYRLMFPGTDLFQTDVSEDLKEEYRQNVFYPMHLGIIREKVSRNAYTTTREFLADTEWILHNCIIFNGAKCELTKVAKNIVRTCVNDMKEIELAPCCFKNIASKKEWFDMPCSPPHQVVLAKVNRYPAWPAKLINSGTEKCDVHFFGAHDRGVVPCSSIQQFTGVLPTPPSLTGSKVKEWNVAVAELQRYMDNVRLAGATNFPTTVTTEQLHDAAPGKDGRPKPPITAATAGVSGHAPSPGGSLVNGQEGEPRTLDGAIPKSLVLDSDSGSESHTQESDAEDKDGEYTPGLEVGLPIKKGRGPAVPRKLSRGTVSLSARGSGLNIATKSVGGVQGGVSTETSGLTMATKGVMQSLGSDVTSLGKGGAAAVGRGVAAPAGRGVATVVGAGAAASKVQLPGGGVVQGNGTATQRPRAPTRKRPPGGDAGAGPKVKRDKNRPQTVPPTTMAHPATTPLASAQPQTTQMSATQLTSSAVTAAIVQQLQNQRSAQTISIATSKMVPMSAPPPTVLPAVPPAAVTPTSAAPVPHPALSVPQPQRLSDQIKEVFKIDSHPALKTDEQREAESKPLPPSPRPPAPPSGGGLLNDTIASVSRSINAHHSFLGPSNDMGFTHYAERLMGSVQLVLLDMLADFHKKGQSNAKELGEGLLGVWPIGSSQRSLQELRRELRIEMQQRVEQIKTAAELECQTRLGELRRELEQSKSNEVEQAVSRAIAETKKKHWCAYCSKEAHHYCCWNADYCSEECQNSHWQEHQKMCLNPQVVGTSVTPSDVVAVPTRAGVPPTPNLMSPTHDGRSQAFSFAQQAVVQGGGAGSGAPGHALTQAMTTDVQSALQTGVPAVAMATSAPTSQSVVSHPAVSGRPAMSIPLPISPSHHHSSTAASHHGNVSNVSSSTSVTLPSHSEQAVHQGAHPPVHSSEGISGVARPSHSVEVAQAAPLATPQTSTIFWPYQQVQGATRYPPGFTPHMMVPTLYPSTDQASMLYQQQLLAEQQGGATGGGAGQH